MKIAFIACSKSKKIGTMEAKLLYSAPDLFTKSYLYAKKHYDKIFILSAKYGLLNPDDIISTYNDTLNDKSKEQKKIWALSVLDKLTRELYFLCGNNYRQFLWELPNPKFAPLKNLGIGKQLKFLKDGL